MRVLGEKLARWLNSRVKRQLTSTGIGCTAVNVVGGTTSYIQANAAVPYSSGTTVFLMCNLGYTSQGSMSSLCQNGELAPLQLVFSQEQALPQGKRAQHCSLRSAVPYPILLAVVWVRLTTEQLLHFSVPVGSRRAPPLAPVLMASGPRHLARAQVQSAPILPVRPLYCRATSAIQFLALQQALVLTERGFHQAGRPRIEQYPGVYESNCPERNGHLLPGKHPDRPSGTVATLMCNAGFSPSGSTTATCQSGSWVPTLGMCTSSNSLFPANLRKSEQIGHKTVIFHKYTVETAIKEPMGDNCHAPQGRRALRYSRL
ncbi:sushi domain protein [Ancylostoma duodenale]|uniref:Sushi domain protein n=1 Tax=Ancylostoma duodenale TaxID=51022 RepID=A0A0C2H5I5_9BILA|nr:sushi domain protein [Ancylostoma duodenale]